MHRASLFSRESVFISAKACRIFDETKIGGVKKETSGDIFDRFISNVIFPRNKSELVVKV